MGDAFEKAISMLCVVVYYVKCNRHVLYVSRWIRVDVNKLHCIVFYFNKEKGT
jgi:hypothetical protein